MNTRSKTDMLNDLYKKYELHKSDTFKSPQGWTIITRSGIDKIQAIANIDIDYEMVEYTPAESAAVKATANWNDRRLSTFGEANPKNCRQRATPRHTPSEPRMSRLHTYACSDPRARATGPVKRQQSLPRRVASSRAARRGRWARGRGPCRPRRSRRARRRAFGGGGRCGRSTSRSGR